MFVPDSRWVSLSAACLIAVLIGRWLYANIGPRRGLPLPPGPRGHWLFGTQFPRHRAPYKLAEMTKEYGPVFSFRQGLRTFVVVGRYHAAMEIMEKEGASVADRPRWIAAGEVLSGGLRVVTQGTGERLRRLRRVLHVALQPKASETYEPVQYHHAKNVVLDILADPECHQMHLQRYAASVTMNITYGKITSTSYGDPEVVAIHRCLGHLGHALRPGAYLVDTYPILQYVPGYLSELKRWYREEVVLFEGQLDAVRKQMAEGKAHPSFAKLLIERQGNYQIDDKEIAYVAGAMFGAGSDTTASAISIAIMAAALHPEAQARVQEELDTVIGRDRLPTFADQEMLPQVVAFTLETSRWRPVSIGGIAHRATKDIVWKGYVIPEGATVIGNHWAIANDPEVFPNPERFDPQRWLTPEGNVRYDIRFCTYGFGRRICPGLHIANRSLFMNTALILWAFRVSDDPKSPIDTFDFTDTINQRPAPFRALFEPRSNVADIRRLCSEGVGESL